MHPLKGMEPRIRDADRKIQMARAPLFGGGEPIATPIFRRGGGPSPTPYGKLLFSAFVFPFNRKPCFVFEVKRFEKKKERTGRGPEGGWRWISRS